MSHVHHSVPGRVRIRRVAVISALVWSFAISVPLLVNSLDEPGGASSDGVAATAAGVRYDGGPEEGTRGPAANSGGTSATRYDGGPEEGSRGIGR